MPARIAPPSLDCGGGRPRVRSRARSERPPAGRARREPVDQRGPPRASSPSSAAAHRAGAASESRRAPSSRGVARPSAARPASRSRSRTPSSASRRRSRPRWSPTSTATRRGVRRSRRIHERGEQPAAQQPRAQAESACDRTPRAPWRPLCRRATAPPAPGCDASSRRAAGRRRAGRSCGRMRCGRPPGLSSRSVPQQRARRSNRRRAPGATPKTVERREGERAASTRRVPTRHRTPRRRVRSEPEARTGVQALRPPAAQSQLRS